MSSGTTIRIGEPIGFPEVNIASDIGQTIDITNLNDFDLGLLGNQKKMVTPIQPTTSVGSELKEVNNIEFVNLDDTNVTFDVKPPVSSVDTIKILRDNSPPKTEPVSTSTVQNNSSTTETTTTRNWFGLPNTENGKTSGWFSSTSSTSSKPQNVEIASTYLTPEQESVKKTEGLTMLERMDRKGIGGNKMTVANSLEEINAEVARRKDSKGLEASLRFQRSMMTTVTSGLEFLNSRYDPLGVNLDGWSEQINENIEDYDEIFEELYDKYKDKTKVAPEVRLVMSLGLSAAMCHLTNTMFKSRMPGMDDILRKNPELAKQMARAAAEQAVGPGFANFMSMAPNNSRVQEPPRNIPQMDLMPEATMEFMPPMGANIGRPIPNVDPRGDVNIGSQPVTARREMRGPTGVEDILRTLETAGQPPSRTMPATAIDAEDLGSVMSGQTTDTQRKAGISRRRKPTVTQAMGSTLTLNV
jgi:hypothetical protein